MPIADQALSHVQANTGESILVMSDLVTIKVKSRNPAGAFALVEVSTPPQGGPPMLHRHADQETFYILEGVYRFDTLEADQVSNVEGLAGSVIQIPSMVWHNYKNIGATVGKMLVILQPGDMIDFFRDLGISVTDRTNLPTLSTLPDMQRVTAIMKKHHVETMRVPSPPQKPE